MAAKSKVKSILISQPEPEVAKSPFHSLAKDYKLKLTFEPFIQVEGISLKEFRKLRVVLTDYNAMIFTSRNAIDHVFRLADEVRVKFSQETKYFCSSEAIALYLQKYTQYRKRKVFYGNGSRKELEDLILKYKDGHDFLYPCSESRNSIIPDFLKEYDFKYREAPIYRTVSTDLSHLKKINYDLIVFFSPLGVRSLKENFPNFEQAKTLIAAYGAAAAKDLENMGYTVNIKALGKEFPSMHAALDNYLKNQ